MNISTENKNIALEAARSTMAGISDDVEALRAAIDNDDSEAREEAERRILESPISVAVRSGWSKPGKLEPEEYMILLSWGKPACRIFGMLDLHNEPKTAELQYQDWGTLWQTLDDVDANDLLAFAHLFYFGE